MTTMTTHQVMTINERSANELEIRRFFEIFKYIVGKLIVAAEDCETPTNRVRCFLFVQKFHGTPLHLKRASVAFQARLNDSMAPRNISAAMTRMERKCRVVYFVGR